MALTLYLVRHGQYDGNVEHTTLAGRSDNRPLNPTGIVQSRNVGRFLKGLTIKTLFSSPVPRALQTAQILGEEMEMTPLVEERISELSYGVLEGKTFVQLEQEFSHLRAAWDKSDRFVLKAPEGESFAELFVRVQAFLTELQERHAPETEEKIVIVTHYAVIHAFLILALKRPERDILFIEKEIVIPNSAVSKIIIADDGQMSVAYAGKKYAYPPKLIRNWVEKRYKGLSDLHLHTGFSRSFVLSFNYEKKYLNMKFYVPEDVKVARKVGEIAKFNQEEGIQLPIPPILEEIETTLSTFPLALVREHVICERVEEKLLRDSESLPLQAASLLKTLHAVPVHSVATFWQSQEYPVHVSQTLDWQAFLKFLISERRQGAVSIEDEALVLLVDEIAAWIKDHQGEIQDADLAPLHGDYYPSNFCIKDEKIIALIDFDLGLIGHKMWELGIGRQRAETYLYPKFATRLEEAYGVSELERAWINCYVLLEAIGSYTHNVLQDSHQQHPDLQMVTKYKQLLFALK